MGIQSSKDIVALIGAHTIGRGFKDRSGVCGYASGDQGATQYTSPSTYCAKVITHTAAAQLCGLCIHDVYSYVKTTHSSPM